MGLTLNLRQSAVHDQKSSVIYCFEVPENRQIIVHSAGVVDKDGNTCNGVEIQLYDDDNGTTEYSTSDEYDEPSSSLSLGGNKIMIQVRNENGTTKYLHGFMEIELS
jgi:hypothetical protein